MASFIVEDNQKLIPLEVKISATPRPSMADGIISFQKDLKEKALPGYIVHSGDITLPLGMGVTAIPFSHF